MAEKRQPTNADLMKEIQSMHESMGLIDNRVKIVENRWLAYDIAKEAVAEYKAQEKSEGRGELTSSVNKELVKGIVAALTIIGTLIAIIQGTS
jgi:hypothetical protein